MNTKRLAVQVSAARYDALNVAMRLRWYLQDINAQHARSSKLDATYDDLRAAEDLLRGAGRAMAHASALLRGKARPPR